MSTQPIVFPAISEIQTFFFDAALATYAGGAKAKTDPSTPAVKFYSFERGDFIYLDKFMVNGEYSGGQTVIYFQGNPVWLMQYQGWCKNDDPAVLAFLKRALRNAYEQRSFYGGRGPSSMSYHSGLLPPLDPNHRKLYYYNEGYGTGYSIKNEPFHKFIGYERIEELDTSLKNEVVFWHRYQGMLLIPNDKGERL